MATIEETGWIFHPLPGLDTVSMGVRPEAPRIILWITLFNVLISNCGFCFAERLKQYKSSSSRKGRGGQVAVIVATAATGAAWLYASVTLVLQNLIWWRYPYSCWLGINVCALIYASTKLLLYLLLIEKTRLLNLTLTNQGFVPSPTAVGRRQDKLWQVNMLAMSPYVAIAVLMLIFQVSTFKGSAFSSFDTCTIGLWLESSVPLLIYDFLFTTVISLELYAGCTMVNSDVMQRVARRNFHGAVVATTVSLTNILLLTIVHKNGMPSEMCFGFCAIDVFVNIRTVHYVMSGKKRGIRPTTAMTNNSEFTFRTNDRLNQSTATKSSEQK